MPYLTMNLKIYINDEYRENLFKHYPGKEFNIYPKIKEPIKLFAEKLINDLKGGTN